MNSPLKDVSDTAFWIAHHRALENARPDALFRDPFAARLAGERGERISAAMPTSRIVAWTVAIRTLIIDDFIRSAIKAGVDTVLNLGAGLDARPYRMQLPATLRWVEADYAHMIEYKESHLASEQPRCQLERVKVDLADLQARADLLARVNSQAGSILVLTEGVTPYLDNAAVATLAEELHATSRVNYWITDYLSPQWGDYRRSKAVARTMQNAPFKFAPEDWFGFFRSHGWHPQVVRYIPEEARRLRRPIPLPLHMKAIMAVMRPFMSHERKRAFRTFTGYALLEPLGRADH